MLRRRASRPATIAVVVMLVVAAIGAIVTAPREYPVTAFLLAPLGAAIVFGRRVTTVVAVLATVAGTFYAIADDHYHGAALWFRLFFLVAASIAIVALTAVPRAPRGRVRHRADAAARLVGTALSDARRGDVGDRVVDRRQRALPRTAPGLGGVHRPDVARLRGHWLVGGRPSERSRVLHLGVDRGVRRGSLARSNVPAVERRDRRLPLHQRAGRADHRERRGP